MSLIQCHLVEDEVEVLEDFQDQLVDRINSDLGGGRAVRVAATTPDAPVQVVPHHVVGHTAAGGLDLRGADMVISDLHLDRHQGDDRSGLRVLERAGASPGVYRVLLTGRESDFVLDSITGKVLPFDMILRKNMVAAGNFDVIITRIDNMLRRRVSDKLLQLDPQARREIEQAIHEQSRGAEVHIRVTFTDAGSFEVQSFWFAPIEEMVHFLRVPQEEMSRRELFQLMAPAAWIRKRVEELRAVAGRMPTLADYFEPVFKALIDHPEEMSKLKELLDLALDYEQTLARVDVASSNLVSWNRLFWGELRTMLAPRLVVETGIRGARVFAGDLGLPAAESSLQGTAIVRFALPGTYRIRVTRYSGEEIFDREVLVHRGENLLRVQG